MGRTNIDIDDELLHRAMRRYNLRTKREAVHMALVRMVGGEPMSIEEQLAMEGVGWEGDLDALRAARLEGWSSDEELDAVG